MTSQQHPQRPITIAIDASRITKAHHTGTEYYALQLIRHLLESNEAREQPYQFDLYFRDIPENNQLPTSKHVQTHVIPFYRLWTHLRFAKALWHSRPDLTFVPAHTLPFRFPGRAVVTVHDLGFQYFPEAHPTLQRYYLDKTTDYSQQRASVVLADSEATCGDLQRFYGTPRDKIEVVYPGVDAPPMGKIASVRQKYNLPERYFLFVGTLQPRKNIQRIVEAYQRWRHAHPDEGDTGLVLAGQKGWLFDEDWIDGIEGVHLTGFVDEVEKGALYTGAMALVFPSLYEGFGFPVLEAMHCGVSVIASNTSSLPELVGDAGILVDPLNVAEIAGAMDILSWRRDLQDELYFKGMKQASKFRWEIAAEQVLRVFDRVLTGEIG